jgi:2-keto-4-pentenoate hydratase/2-oxohepta-3-ene-1,7-dioic acid hydratase in catechol pathway
VREFFVATVEEAGIAAAAVVAGEDVHIIPGRLSVAELLADWDAALERLEGDLNGGALENPRPVESVRFLPPVPAPPNLYMAGANYADHVREMRGLGPTDPVERAPEGPFVFLKPTTTLIGHRAAVVLPASHEQVDWEVELAAVVGRRAHNVETGAALDYVAGYTVVNDISVRDAFKRAEGTSPALTWDWLWQKGWYTSCPCGPWLLPAQLCPRPGDLGLRLTLNGQIEQDSRTSQLIFSLEEIIAFLSHINPLVPGDIICTGTPAGVGAGKGRFLAPGDVMVAEIEGIGILENPVAAAAS